MSPTLLESARSLRLKGISFRRISRSLGVPRSTLHYHLSKTLTDRQVKRGSIAVIEEFLRNPNLRAKQRAEIRCWMNLNLDRIMQVDDSSGIELLTQSDENKATRRECGWRGDFRDKLQVGGYAA